MQQISRRRFAQTLPYDGAVAAKRSALAGDDVARRPTLSAIAERAGTSIPTASKALRGGTDVAPATRERILRVAEELGYAPPKSAAAPQESGLVDFVLASGESSWTNRALTGAAARSSRAR